MRIKQLGRQWGEVGTSGGEANTEQVFFLLNF